MSFIYLLNRISRQYSSFMSLIFYNHSCSVGDFFIREICRIYEWDRRQLSQKMSRMNLRNISHATNIKPWNDNQFKTRKGPPSQLMMRLTRCLIDRKERLSVTINITTLDAGECSCLNVLSMIASTDTQSKY